MPKHVVIIAALDTKGAEARFLRDLIADHGAEPLVVDVGVLGSPAIPAQISREEVARAVDVEHAKLVADQDKGQAMAAMTRGAAVTAQRLYAEGRLDGIIGLGGSAGTTIASSAMRGLPVGVPKVIVSTVASGDTRPYVGSKDIAMVYSIVDIAGIRS